MNNIEIIVIDYIKKSTKRAKIDKNDLISFINLLEDNQIMIAKGVESTAVFMRDKKVVGFQQIGSIRSIIESL
jgi:hypothetical protein